MKIWIDDLRVAPAGYVWCKSVNEAKVAIEKAERMGETIEYLDLDHDAGDYQYDGGDFIKVLDWMEETGRAYACRIHTANPVGRQNMRMIVRKNGWEEIS